MAFGDPLPEAKPTYSFKDVIGTVQSTSIEFVPIDTTAIKVRKETTAPVPCCEDAYNVAVEHGTGVPFCLKCRKPMTFADFYRVLHGKAKS